MKAKKVEISYKTVVFTVLILILLWLLYQIIGVIVTFFIAFLIMTILNPMVTKLSNYKIPRGLSVLVVYILALAFVATAVGLLVPPLVEQTTSFANDIQKYLGATTGVTLIGEQVVRGIGDRISTLPEQAIKVSVSVFTNIWVILMILILAFYMLVARDKLDDQLTLFFGERNRYKKTISEFLDELEAKLGGWARAELILMFSIGLVSFIGFSLLKLPFALPLAIFAGLLEIIPILGPVVAAIPAVIIGFGVSPVIGLATLAFVILVQQLENSILLPKVMEKSVGVSPIVTLLAIAIGSEIAGIVGIIISVPIFITIKVVYQQFYTSNN